jgi:hypothetical protein
VPDDVGAHVVLDPALDKLVALLLAVGAAVEEAFKCYKKACEIEKVRAGPCRRGTVTPS